MNFSDKIKTLNHVEDKKGYEHNLFEDDRDLTNLIINCYKYLNNAKLCAYSLDITTNKELWFCNAQNHLYKAKKANKNVTIDDIDENNIDAVFNASFDILDRTSYQTLKLKYIVEPNLIEKKSRYMCIINTLQRFDSCVSEYDTQFNEIKKLLENRIEEIPEEDRVINHSIPFANEDLFIVEKVVFLPIFDNKRHVYLVDNAKYYGIFSDNIKGRLTSSGKYGLPYIAENNTIATTYIGIDDDKFYITGFGDERRQNIFTTFFYTENYKINEIKKHSISDFVDINEYDEYHQMIWFNTWDACIKNYTKDIVKKDNPNPKSKKDLKISLAKISRRNCIQGVKQYVDCKTAANAKTKKESDRLPHYIYALELEKRILYLLNGGGPPSPKMSNPTVIKKRITINPFAMIKGVFKYSKEDPIMESNQTEPNPFDIMWMLSYRKASTHVMNKGNRDRSYHSQSIEESQRYILYYDLYSIGEFSSKGNQAGIKGMLRPGIEGERVQVNRRGLITDD